MGIPIPIPNIPGNFGNGNENLSLGIIPTIPGNMGMGMNFRGKSQILMWILLRLVETNLRDPNLRSISEYYAFPIVEVTSKYKGQ